MYLIIDKFNKRFFINRKKEKQREKEFIREVNLANLRIISPVQQSL